MVKDKGYVLILALVIAATLTILLQTIIGRIVIQRKHISLSHSQTKALAVAESGIDAAFAYLNENEAFDPPYPIISGSVDDMGTFTVEISGTTIMITMQSTGVVTHESTTVQRKVTVEAVRIGPLAFDYAIFAVEEVSVAGGGYISGDVAVVEGGTVKGTDYVEIDERIIIPDVPFPSPVPTSATAYILPTGTDAITGAGPHYYTDMTISGGTLTIGTSGETVKIRVTGDLKVQGNGKIKIATGCSVSLYVDGKIDIRGQGIVNCNEDPSTLVIFGTGSCALAGGEVFYGAIYAPKIEIDITGGAQVIGSIVGDTVAIKGEGEVEYDPRVKNIKIHELELFRLIPGSWAETR